MYAADNGGEDPDQWGTRWAYVVVPVPTNDLFTSALSISGLQGSTNGTLVRATRETSEPNHAGNANTPSVWFAWTAPTNGLVAISAVGSNSVAAAIHAVVAIYTGSSLASLSWVTNHQAVGGTEVVFNATSNTTYEIAVAGWDGQMCDFTLHWNQARVPYFSHQPQHRDVFMGSNVTFSALAIGVPTISYQWRSNGVNISGATSESLAKNNVQTNDTADYTVVATNSSGSTTSIVAHLQVYSTQQALLSAAQYVTNTLVQTVSGITGAWYVVEASTNLINWVTIETNQTTFTNLDRTVTNYAYRFYRVRYVP